MTRILIFALAAVLSTADPTESLKASAPVTKTTNMTAIQGEAFDRAFVAQLVRDEQEAVDRLHQQADRAAALTSRLQARAGARSSSFR